MNLNPSIFDISWGGPNFSAYDGLMWTTSAVVPDNSSAAVVPSPGTGASAGSPSAASTSSASGTDNPNDPNLQVLRDSHKQYTEWKGKLGDFEQAHTTVQTFQRLSQEAETVGAKLGYTLEEVKASFKEDPVGTLAILRQEANAAARKVAGQGGQPRNQGQPDLKKMIQDELKPITERHQQQIAREANNLFNTTVDSLVDTDFAEMRGSEEYKDAYNLISDAASELMKYDEAGLKALQAGGPQAVAAIKKAYADAKDIFVRGFTAYQKYLGRKSGQSTNTGGNNNQGGNGNKKFTLDDFIAGEGNLAAFGKPHA